MNATRNPGREQDGEFVCPIEGKELRLAPETITRLRHEFKGAMADGIRDGITGAFTLMKKEATFGAGRFILGRLWTLSWMGLVILLVGYFAGWPWAKVAWKALAP